MHWILATMLFVTPLMAKTIGNVEYALPPSIGEWKIGNEFQISKTRRECKVVIYIPPESSMEDTLEFFGVNANGMPFENLDQAGLEKYLKTLFADMTLQVNIIEQDPTSVLYEWSATRGDEVICGLSRSFASWPGTVLLSYQAEDRDLLEQRRDTWLEALKAAKIKKDE